MDKYNEFMQQVFEFAAKGEHNKFEFIRCMEHRKTVKIYVKGMRKLVKGLKQIYQSLLKQYKESQLKIDLHDLLELQEIILSYKTVIEFYQTELDVAVDMLKEFRTYLWSNNNLFKIGLFHGYREDNELVDFRTIPVSFF